MAGLAGRMDAWRRGWPRVVPAAIIVAALLAIAFLGFQYNGRLPLLAAGAVAGLFLVGVLLRRPALGPLVLVTGALLVPLEIGTGTQSRINIAVVLCAGLAGLWVLEVLLRRAPGRLVPSHTVWPALALGVVALVAFAVGQLGWFYRAPAPLRSQLGGLALFLLSIAAFLLVANRVRDERWLARLTWIFLGAAAVLVAARFAQGYIRFPTVWNEARGAVFWVWVAALATAQALYNDRLHLTVRVLLGGLAGSVFFVGLVLEPGWTAGWGPALVAVVVTIGLGRPRWGLFLTLVGAAFVVLNWARVDTLLLSGGGEYGQAWSIYTRGEAWRASLELARFSPIIGFGPANYFFYTPMVRLIRWNVQFVTHNQYLDLLLQTGIIGLICFLWFAWEAGRLGWRLRMQVPAGFSQAYVYGALGGLAGTLVAGMLVDYVIPFVYNIGLAGFRSSVLAWVFLGGLVVLERRVREQGRETSGDT